MFTLVKRLALSIFLFISQVHGADVDDNGHTDIFSYYVDSSSFVAQNATGEVLSSVPLPIDMIGEYPLVYPGRWNDKPVAFSIIFNRAQRESTLFMVTQEEEVFSQPVGSIKGAIIMMYDADSDTQTDLTIVRKTGEVVFLSNLFTDNQRTFSRKVPRLRRNTRATLTSCGAAPCIVLYRSPKRRRATQFLMYNLTNDISLPARFTVRRKIRAQLYPIAQSAGLTPNKFVMAKANKNQVYTSISKVDLESKKVTKHRITASSSVIPGNFSALAGPHQVVTVGKTLKVLDLDNRALPVVELVISSQIAQTALFVSAPLSSLRRTGSKISNQCTVTQDGRDGPGNFLLKASDHDRNLVVLLPANLPQLEVSLVTNKGKLIERLRYTGVSNGFRGTYRGSRTPTAYPRELVVKATLHVPGYQKESLCYVIQNSHVRND